MNQTSGPPGDIGAAFPAVARVEPAGIGRRALARLLDLVIVLAATGSLAVIALLGPDASDPQAVSTFALVVQVASVLLTLGLLIAFAVTGLLPGGALIGVRQVRVATGGAPGAAGVVKYLVLGLLSLVTFGLGYLATIVLIPRDPWNRSWVDRWLGLLVIDIREGRDPRHESVGGSLVSDVVPLSQLSGQPGSAPAPVGAAAAAAAPVVAPPPPAAPPAPPTRRTAPPPTRAQPAQPPAPQPQSPQPQSPQPQAPQPQAPQSQPSPSQPPQPHSAQPHTAPAAPAPAQARPAAQPVQPAVVRQAPVAAPTPLPASAAAPAGEEPVTRVNPQVGGDVKPVRVRLPDGNVVLIDRPTAFGRNPAQPPGRPDAQLVAVDDPGKSVSKTHAVLTPQPGGVLVEDLRSTNGTSILTDRGHVVVPAGVRLAARVGWRVALADLVLVVEDA